MKCIHAVLCVFTAILLTHITDIHAQTNANLSSISWSRFIPQDKVPVGSSFTGLLTKNEKRTLVVLTEEEKIKLNINKDVLAYANFAKYHETDKKVYYYVIEFPGIKINTPKTLENMAKIVATRSKFGIDTAAKLKTMPSLVVTNIIQNIKDVNFVKEHWSEGARPGTTEVEVHSMLRFIFQSGPSFSSVMPRLVINQTKIEAGNFAAANVPLDEQKQTNLIISGEAVRPDNDPNASFMPSAFKVDFAIAHLIYNYETRQVSTAAEGGTYEVLQLNFSKVKNYKYKEISGSPMLALLLEGFHRNLALARAETYNIFIKNCTNVLFEIIDDVLKFTPNYQHLKDDINLFIEKDMPVLVDHIESTGVKDDALPKEVQEFLKANTVSGTANNETLLLKYVQSLPKKLETTSITDKDVKFLAPWPPFVEGQLKSRNLFIGKYLED